MRSITREELITRLTEIEPRSVVERGVDGAIASLGWDGREEFSAPEVIALGTRMAELAAIELAASDAPDDRRAAAEMRPLVEALRQDVLPVIGPNGAAL